MFTKFNAWCSFVGSILWPILAILAYIIVVWYGLSVLFGWKTPPHVLSLPSLIYLVVEVTVFQYREIAKAFRKTFKKEGNSGRYRREA